MIKEKNKKNAEIGRNKKWGCKQCENNLKTEYVNLKKKKNKDKA